MAAKKSARKATPAVNAEVVMDDETIGLLLDAEASDNQSVMSRAEGALRPLLEQLAKAYENAEKLDALTKANNVRIFDIESNLLPNLMKELGVKDLVLADGTKVAEDVLIEASIAKRMPTVITWLRKEGYEALIKRQISIAFGKGEEKRASTLLERLAKWMPDMPVQDKEEVNAATFKAHMSELLREKKVSVDTAASLGISTRERVKVTPPKVKATPRG